MYELIKNSLVEWNQSRTDRVKLQHSYVATIVILVFVAGVIGLVNDRWATITLIIAIALLTALVVNLVAWSLLKTLLLDKLKLPRRTTTAARATTQRRNRR